MLSISAKMKHCEINKDNNILVENLRNEWDAGLMKEFPAKQWFGSGVQHTRK